MNGLGIPVSSCLLEKNATKEVLQLIKIAHNRNISIYYPTDLWCLNSNNNEQLEIFDSAELLSGEYDWALFIYLCIFVHVVPITRVIFTGNGSTNHSLESTSCLEYDS